MKERKLVTIIIADDDAEDRLMIRKAFEELMFSNPVVEVTNGEELLDYIYKRGKYAGETIPAKPGIILLDLNMPKIDGREALREIKKDPEFRRIPIIVLTTSKAEEDILRSYDIGANSFIIKPVSLRDFVAAIQKIGKYWIELVEIPNGHG